MPFPVPVAAEGCGSREKVFGYEVTELKLCVYGELGSLRLLCFNRCREKTMLASQGLPWSASVFRLLPPLVRLCFGLFFGRRGGSMAQRWI